MNFLKRVPYINMLYINVYNVNNNVYKNTYTNLDVLIHGSLYLKSSKKILDYRLPTNLNVIVRLTNIYK